MNKFMAKCSTIAYLLCLFSSCFAQGNSSLIGQTQKEIDELTHRLVESHLNMEVVPYVIEHDISTIQADGCWLDINYDTVVVAFPAGKHLERLREMAVAYRKPDSKYCDSKFLLDKILLGFDYYYKKQPVSKNWWYIDIGAPQDYMVALLLLKGKIDKQLLFHYSSYLKDRTGNRAHKGKNRTWVSDVTIHKGCIEDDINLIRIGFESVASTIKIVPEQGNEGIKIDGSFHQHRAQLYSGGYGMSIMDDLAKYIRLADGTEFSSVFTPDKKKILSDVLLKGHQLFGYRKAFDFGTVGRNITRNNSVGNISVSTLDLMMQNDPDNIVAYQTWKKHIDGAPFPIPGNKYFWKSDIMTYHGKNYYLSAKIISAHTVGTEMINMENFRGYNLPLGATNIMTTGKEYKNIYPIWDWTKIPGTTAIQNQDSTKLTGYLFGTNDFGGGVSNGKSGIIAYEHNYKGLRAKKAYFFMEDAMFCLGTDISFNSPEYVATSVNQCFFSGIMTVGTNNETKTYTKNVEVKNPTWVYHDNVGYIFPSGGNVVVCASTQTGSWRNINIDGDKKELSGDVFSIWFNHGKKPIDESYFYIVVPDKSLMNFHSFMAQNRCKVVENNADVQAIRNDAQQMYAIVFYTPGTIDMGNGMIVSSDKKVILYIEKKKGGYEISAADPLYCQESVHLKLNNTDISLTFPTDAFAGSTVTHYYKN